uniref:Uncharacterized protein n=3 Tax=Phlebotomus papatasi TaxID=29031 RepID=A0A1B0DHW3_PHLPP
MPQSEGGYVSLENGPRSVYNATTEPTSGAQSVLESVKRAIGQAIGSSGHPDAPLLNSKSPTTISIVSA